jgi:hypothetical protein
METDGDKETELSAKDASRIAKLTLIIAKKYCRVSQIRIY